MKNSTIQMFLFFLPLLLRGGSEHVFIEAELNDTAVLPCSGRCSGLVTWTEFRTRVPVAQCDQTSCTPLKEGFMMSHDQYMKDNLSLIISGADYRKKNWYKCQCEGSDLCDVTLRIKPLKIMLQVERGGSFIIDVPVLKEVKVLFNRTQGSVNIYTESGSKTDVHPDYERRVSVGSSLHFRDIQDPDSGIYTLWDTFDDELIATYNVTVMGPRPTPDTSRTTVKIVPGTQGHGEMFLAFMMASCGLLGLLVGFFGLLCIQKWRCRRKDGGSTKYELKDGPDERYQLQTM